MSENMEIKTTQEETQEAMQDSNFTSIFREPDMKKNEAAAEILKELNTRFITVKENGRLRRGFRMDDSSNQIGLLSQCQCMQTMVSLAQDFGLKFTDVHDVNGEQLTIRDMMDYVIEDILIRVCVLPADADPNDDKRFENATGYIFDASPYNSTCFNEKFSNVDTITWVITSFLLVLKHHAEVLHEVCKWEKALINVIRYGMDYLNDAFIDKQEEGKKSSSLVVGWNFTKQCEEPSLYFSNAVCECFLDIYNTFEPFLEHLHAVRDNERYHLHLDEARSDYPDVELKEKATKFKSQKKTFDKKKAEYIKYRKEENEWKIDENTGKVQACYDEYNEMVRIYRRIMDIDDFDRLSIEGNRYGKLEENCKKTALAVWELTQKDLAEMFFYNDLANKVTEKDIRMSTTSDVLFNTVYIINTMLCAGVDETLQLKKFEYLVNPDADEKSAQKAEQTQQELDNLLESCMLAVQKAFRTYESLKNNGKDYIVDQFLIGFNEDFAGHPVAINELRKLRMRTFSLMPMLINANNKVCQYLVKYPHYNMDKYHRYILDNRLVKDGAVHWIWERDGYFSGSNYYYVLALEGFYSYYAEYEEKYILIGESNADREQEIRKQYLTELHQEGGEIKALEDEITEQKAIVDNQKTRIAELEEENKKRPVENAVLDVVDKMLEERFAQYLAKTLLETAAAIETADKDKADEEKNHYDLVNDNLRNLLVAAVIQQFGSGDSKTRDKLRKRVGKDLQNVMAAYATDLNSGKLNSKLYKLFQEEDAQ